MLQRSGHPSTDCSWDTEGPVPPLPATGRNQCQPLEEILMGDEGGAEEEKQGNPAVLGCWPLESTSPYYYLRI
jgi:hypothetical protein